MDQTNIVDYLDENLNNEQDMEKLMDGISQMPQSQPNFNVEQQPMTYEQPVRREQPEHNFSHETVKRIQSIVDANQIPNATIVSTQPGSAGEVSHAMSIDGEFYPLIMFQNSVVQQVQSRMMQQNRQRQVQPVIPMQPTMMPTQQPIIPIQQTVPMQPFSQPIPENPKNIIDLSQKPELTEDLTSHSRGVPEDEIKENESMIAPLFRNYNKSILVFVLILILMNNLLDGKVIALVPFLTNNYAMLGLKALILTIIYHIITAFIVKN